MDIVVLSGGSGNDALIKGLKKLYRGCNVKVIVNAYDNGKSTGVCRSITNTLGVSDIRKNHIRMYKALTTNPDANILEFYDKRFDFTRGNERQEVAQLLVKWNLTNLVKYADAFFTTHNINNYTFSDFSVANIVYAQMYAELGYEETNRYFCNLLNIEDFVILNSFDNVFIQAITKSGKVIKDEGDIVEYKDATDPIINLDYIGNKQNQLNPEAVKLIENADLIVISTGTFWSSIFPTLQYGDLYKTINTSKAKKVWAMNNEEDKDSFGIGSLQFIQYVENLGLDTKDFMILVNEDAKDILKQTDNKHSWHTFKMGNTKGKHDGVKYAKAILTLYYGLDNYKYLDHIIFDFDDTLWSRKDDQYLHDVSISNIKTINKLTNALIVSGNSWLSIRNKLSTIFGADLQDFNVDIWADANSTLYRNAKEVDHIEATNINYKDIDLLAEELKKYDIEFNDKGYAYLKIKPLTERERTLLTDLLNNYIFNKLNLRNLRAYKTGITTVDILNTNNDKSVVFQYLKLKNSKTLYIGDEVDSGNDNLISSLCTFSIHTSGVEETNLLLRLLLGEE